MNSVNRRDFVKKSFFTLAAAGTAAGMASDKKDEPKKVEEKKPEEVAVVPPRYAIDRRNKWMLKQADFVVTYITHDWGGAAKFAKMAEKQGKKVINLD